MIIVRSGCGRMSEESCRESEGKAGERVRVIHVHGNESSCRTHNPERVTRYQAYVVGVTALLQTSLFLDTF